MKRALEVGCVDESVDEAVELMLGALAILDRRQPLAAATLSLAIEQAGGLAPNPEEEFVSGN